MSTRGITLSKDNKVKTLNEQTENYENTLLGLINKFIETKKVYSLSKGCFKTYTRCYGT